MTGALKERFQNLLEFVTQARTNLNRNTWDYLIGGSETETTLARNRAALDAWGFRPRVSRDVSNVDCSRTFSGKKLRNPVLCSAVDSLEEFDPNGGATVAAGGELCMSNASTPYAIITAIGTAVIGLLAMAAFAIRPVYAQMTCSQFGWHGKNYENANLVDANFQNVPNLTLMFANFRGADLRGAVFTGQGLECADFTGARLGLSPNTGKPTNFSSTVLIHTIFKGASIGPTDLTNADFDCADFSSTNLTAATFSPPASMRFGAACRTSFAKALIPAAAIPVANWNLADFTGATLQGVQNLSLANQNLTGAILSGVDLSEVVFTGSNLTGVNLTSANLANANLVNTALNGAVLQNANLKNANLTCAVLNQRSTNDTSNCPHAPVSNQAAAAVLVGANLTGATLDKAALPGVNLAGATLGSTSLRGADLTGANLAASASYDPALVAHADFTGAHLQYANISGVSFAQSVLAQTDFSHTTLYGTSFPASVMSGAVFAGTQLQNVSFAGASMQNAVFTGASFSPSSTGSPVNFSCAQLGGANFSNVIISGSTQYAVSFYNAVMPSATQCCQSSGNPPYCGLAASTGLPYGGVTYPKPQAAPVLCPDGSISTGTVQSDGSTIFSCSAAQWTIPNWTTNACGSATQIMWSKPDCGGHNGSDVTFNDSNLKACILAQLPGNPTELPVATAQTIRTVDCAGKGIKDPTGLENFWALERLDLSANQLTSFTLVANNTSQKFAQLDDLNLADNAITTANLIAFPNITALNLSNNQLTGINFSGNMQLATLLLYNNRLTSLSPPWSLASQTALSYVDLSGNMLASVLQPPATNLQSMTKLQTLDLSNNQLTSIGSISPVLAQNLQRLSLACNPTFSCASLGTPANQPMMANSYCAVQNGQTANWQLATNPSCPPGLTRESKQPAPMQRPGQP